MESLAKNGVQRHSSEVPMMHEIMPIHTSCESVTTGTVRCKDIEKNRICLYGTAVHS